MIGFALTYEILLHFEKTLQPYNSQKIIILVATRFHKMNIALGNIVEPIVPLCSLKENKPWNNMVKVNHKNPNVDGTELLIGRRVFALFLDRCIKIPKSAKSHDNTARKDILALKFKSNNIKSIKSINS